MSRKPIQRGLLMITIAIRAREIVSSNVDSLVGKAGEPRKMLRLLQSEVEETLIALHGDAAKAKRQQGRMQDSAARLADAAEEWTAKAKIAIDHGREDLARAALLTREAERAKAADAAAAAEALGAQIEDAASVIADLETKRTAIMARIAEMAQTETAASGPVADTHIEKRIDRIEALERRAGFADAPAETPSPAALDDEIAGLQKASAIEAELAALKATAAPAKKAAGKKRG
jgi:phage shock protein A